MTTNTMLKDYFTDLEAGMSKKLAEKVTARRTFILLCLSKGMPIQDVMKISGHSDFKSMKPYMRITRKDIRAVADRWDI